MCTADIIKGLLHMSFYALNKFVHVYQSSLLFSKQKNVMTESKEKKPKVDRHDISDSPRTKIQETRQAPLKKRPTGASEN